MPKRRNPYRAYWVDWSPEVAFFFQPLSVLCAGMPEPRQVRVYPGKRHVTLIAHFQGENGRKVTAKVKTS